MRSRTSFCIALLVAASAAVAVDVTITWNQWPYGVRYIGSYSKWWSSPDGSHVTVPSFNPDDTIWDLSDLGGPQANRNAESWIMTKQSAQGTPPALCTYAEKQVQGGQVSWGYEHMDTTGLQQYMWLYGFYTQSTQIDYDPPYQRVYAFPMQMGDNWTEVWTWNYLGMDLVTETRDNYIVAQGWVKVQVDTTRYYPCLVLRTYSTSTDELGAINEMRVIHEWVVPDCGLVGGSVATIQSQNGVTNPNFTDAEHVFRMKEFHSVFDNTPPSFAGTTRVPSGYNLGPFAVSSTITDQNGVAKDSIYMRIGSGSWVALSRDSTRSSTFYFHIPQLGGADSVRYYLAASDMSPGQNRGTDPSGAPTSYYSFFARDPSDDHFPPVISGTTQYNDTVFVGPFPVSTTVVDSCSVDTVRLWYRFNTGAEQPVAPDSVRGSIYYMTIPQAPMNTFIRYRIRAVDGSPNHNAAYDPGSGYYSFNVIDGAGPTFAATTELYDTTYPGPFYVTSQITDPSGVYAAAIFFKMGSLAWDSLMVDSSSGNTYSFHIPEVTAPMSVRYYIKAWDNSQNRNPATDPTGAPGSYYVFFCDPVPGVAEPGRIAPGRYVQLAGVNPTEIRAGIGATGRLSLVLYDIRGGLVATICAGERSAGAYRFRLPSGLASGTYVLRASFGSEEHRQSFVISR